jgi:hypothetical protein
MNSIPEPIPATHLLSAVPAANADRLGEQPEPAANVTETGTGWDAYDVWRRFIRDARERRLTGHE